MLQSTALDVMKSGANVFLTGSAGAGKSYTIREYIKYLIAAKISASKIAITATTGIAATNIGGTTIHSFSCIGVKEYMTDDEIIQLLLKRKNKLQDMLETEVLFVDEISMLHKRQFELASRIVSLARKDSRPFGGMQVIVIGDFFQLPPVSKNNEAESNRDRFPFMSKTWVDCNFSVCYLTEQHRTTSGDLNDVLNAIRNDDIQDKHVQILESRMIQSDNKQILNLYTHNENVDLINYTQLQKLEGESKFFKAETCGNEISIKSLISQISAPEKLELKVGAKVMFVKNEPDEGYANGTQGVIDSFIKDDEQDPPFLPVVKTTDGQLIVARYTTWETLKNDKFVASFKQIPLRLAWAITIHKSQGMSLDQANINLGRVFEDGQGFVALSRLKTLEGLYIEDFKTNALKLNSLARKADIRFRELSDELEFKMENLPKKDIENAHKSFIKAISK